MVDGDHRIKSGRVHGGQLVGVVRDLVLIGQRIELRQNLRGEAVRNVHRFSRIGEDPAPLDAHPEGVGADALAGQVGIGDVLRVRARTVFGHRTLPAEQQLVERVMGPLPPVGVDVQRRTATHLGLEARRRDTPPETFRERQCGNSSRAVKGELHRRGRGGDGQVIREQRSDERDGAQQPDRCVQQTLQSVDVGVGLIADRHGESVGAAVGGEIDHRGVGEVAGALIDADPTQARFADDGVDQSVSVRVGRAERSGHHPVGGLGGDRGVGRRVLVEECAFQFAACGSQQTPRGGCRHRSRRLRCAARRRAAGRLLDRRRRRADPGAGRLAGRCRGRGVGGTSGTGGVGGGRCGQTRGHRGADTEGNRQRAHPSDGGRRAQVCPT